MEKEEMRLTTLLFNELAERIRDLVREELAEGTNQNAIVALVADMDDPSARKVLESLDCREENEGRIVLGSLENVGGHNRRVACVLTDRMVIATVCTCAPKIATAFTQSVPEGQVLTIVIADGRIEVVHLKMELEPSLDMTQEDIDTRISKMLEENKQYLVKMVREEIDSGRDINELLCVIFDLSEETPRKIMSALIPEMDLDAAISKGGHMVNCRVTHMGCLDRLDKIAPGFKEMVPAARPVGSIFTMVLFGDYITGTDLFMTDLKQAEEEYLN
jgi:hypothetical protein